ARGEPCERPRFLIRRLALRDRLRERVRQLGPHRGGETLAAADGLPHLAELLRPGPRALRLAASGERRADEVEQVLLLACVQPTGDSLPEIPHLGPTLHGARMAELRPEHAPELLDADTVASVTEPGPQEEAGEVQ